MEEERVFLWDGVLYGMHYNTKKYKLQLNIIISLMSPELLNGYQQSQKGTQTTANLTTTNITARFNNSSLLDKKSDPNQPIELFKEDSQSSDAQIIYKQPIAVNQASGSLPKKLPINQLHYSNEPDRYVFKNLEKNRKNNKYTSIEQISYEHQKTEVEHNQIRKFIKKADRLNEENYRKLQIQRSRIPAFNTSSNLNIYKSNKNILEEIGAEEPIERRIKQIYMRNQKNSNNKRQTKNTSLVNRSLNNNQGYKTNRANNYGKGSKNHPVEKKTIEIQTDAIEAGKTQRGEKERKAKFNKAYELMEEDPNYEIAVPKKNISQLTQKRNNRIFSNTLNVLNDQSKSPTINIADVINQQGGRYSSYSKAQAEEYLNNLSKTQYDFLKSVRNEKRSISALTIDDPIYQTTVFGTTNETQFMQRSQKLASKQTQNMKMEIKQENARDQPRKLGNNYNTLEPISKIRAQNHWENMEIEQPQNFKKFQKLPEKILPPTITSNRIETAKISKIQRKTELIPQKITQKKSQQKLQTKNNTKIQQKPEQKMPTQHNKIFSTQNSMAVQRNQSNNNQSNSPEELKKHVSHMSRIQNSNLKFGNSEKNQSREFAPTLTYNSFLDKKKFDEMLLDEESPLLNGHQKRRVDQQQEYENTMKNFYLDSPKIEKAEKSIQAPQIPKLDVFTRQNQPKFRQIHPITISFDEKDKLWITKEYYESKMKSRILNITDPNSKIMADKFIIKKYRNGVYFGQIDQATQCKHGYGAIFYFNGKMYEGFFKNDLKEGKGTQNFPDGATYAGQYVAGLKNGKGTYTWGNGKQVYEGQWVNGKRNGSGMWKKFVKNNKYDIYIGEWNNGRIEGFGVLTVADGHRYEGQFRNSEKQGLGTERYENGDTFVGQFRKSRPNGTGEYYWSTGGYYKGQFSNGLKHGKGYYKGERQSQKQQQPENLPVVKPPQKKALNKKSDPKQMVKTIKKSKISQPQPKIFKEEDQKQSIEYWGEFRNDKKCGFGEEKVLEHDGREYIYRGNFENDMRHGYGEIIEEGKFTVKGYWINGVKVGEEMPVIEEDQLERVESLPQNIAHPKAKIRKQGIESLSKGKKKIIKKSISPKASPKRSLQKLEVHDHTEEGDQKRACGCKRNH